MRKKQGAPAAAEIAGPSEFLSGRALVEPGAGAYAELGEEDLGDDGAVPYPGQAARPSSRGENKVAASSSSRGPAGRRAKPESGSGVTAIPRPPASHPKGQSMRTALGLPRVGKAYSSLAGRGSPGHESIPEALEESSQFGMSEACMVLASGGGVQSRAATPASEKGFALQSARGGAVDKGRDHIADMLSWMKPRTKDGGFLSSLTRLSVEIDHVTQEWSAALGGRVSRRESLDAILNKESPVKDPLRTAQAASLLLRITKSFPVGLPLRSMLEPLVQELMEAIYTDWPVTPSLDDLRDDDISIGVIMKHTAFYALLCGHKSLTEEAVSRAHSATAEAESNRQRAAPREAELAKEKHLTAQLQEQLVAELKARQDIEAQLQDSKETYDRFLEQTKHALRAFSLMEFREQSARADLSNMLRDHRDKEVAIAELQTQTHVLTQAKNDLEDTVHKLKARLEKKDAETDQLPALKTKLEQYETQDALVGLGFATRIVADVFGTTIDELSGAARRGNRKETTKQKTKIVLDAVCSKLKSVVADLEEQRALVRRLRMEVKDVRQLVPIWNADADQDLQDAYNANSPIHHQVFSMKDRRSFAGLGTGPKVPLYLRAEGFVRHIFVSKAELEEFMASFREHLFNDQVAVSDITTDMMHQELYAHMAKTHHGDNLQEFGYAFICGLEAYRDDPDFELCDLMLSGAVHPSITQDQEDMLRELLILIRSCQEGQVEDQVATRAPKIGRPSTLQGSGRDREQVSRRVIRAVMQAIFPGKTFTRQNALRRALHMTLQMLSEQAKTPSPDCAFISDLFAATQDGGQTMLIEEIRRQHYYEVVDFTAELARRIRRPVVSEDDENTFSMIGGEVRFVDSQALRKVIMSIDPHAKQARVEKMVLLACPQPGGVTVNEALRRLRQGALLKPERLWVRVQPKDVVAQLLSMGPPTDEGASGEAGESHNMTDSDTTRFVQPRRIRALKVVDNPMAKMQSDVYNTPEGLQNAILQNHTPTGADVGEQQPHG